MSDTKKAATRIESGVLPAAGGIMVTAAEELLKAGKSLGSAVNPGNGLQPYVIVPHGYEKLDLDYQPEKPLRGYIKEEVRLDDMDSFIGYVKAFRTHTTRLFAAAVDLEELSEDNAGGAEFTAILDYHQGGADRQVSRAAHSARYPVPLSMQFSRWLGKNAQAFNQLDFVGWIENNAGDIVTPDSATLMEIVLNFEAKTNVDFQSKVERLTGGKVLTYQETVDPVSSSKTTGQIKVPEFLQLFMPVFEGGKSYELKARLEYRPQGGRLFIIYHLQRPHDVFRLALRTLREEIAAALELEILTGKILHTDS